MFDIITYRIGSDEFLGIPAFKFNTNHGVFAEDWKSLINDDSLYNFTDLENVQPRKKYVVYLKVYNHWFRSNFLPVYSFHPFGQDPNTLLQNFYMPRRVSKDSKKGLVHWLIDFGTECFQLNSDGGTHFKELCKALNTTPKNITLITGAETCGIYGQKARKTSEEQGYNCVTSFELFDFLNLQYKPEIQENYRLEKINDIVNKKELNYKSLCYNRLPRPHRTTIVAHIIKNKYNDSTLYSLGTSPGCSRDDWREHFPELESEINALANGSEIYPHIREDNVDLNENQASTIGWNHGLNSYFQLVTETTPDNARYPFVTEKSLKPFAMLQPFIQYGPKDNIKVLKSHGYDTFDEWIDHSYDDEEDDVERLKLVLKEFDRLQNLSSKTWSNMLKEMLPSLLHNYQLVRKPVYRNLTSQLTPILFKFYRGENN